MSYREEKEELREKIAKALASKEKRLFYCLFYGDPDECSEWKLTEEFIQRVKPLLEEELRKQRGK
jgi:K+/H+ antiporter YhaU regulatory subunit KhtT